MKTKITIKQILLSNQNWWHFYTKHKDKIRPAIVICITKLLSCKNTVRGFREYICSNPNCSHTKRIPFTCKGKACSSCGKKATEEWIQKQSVTLPETSWQHITFTMPSELWDFFWYNRQLLNQISKIAAHCLITLADQRKITLGIFTAIHTFGRDLKRNAHIHLSTTHGGLTFDHTKWKKMFFHQKTLMHMWRYQIIAMFRNSQKQLVIPPAIQKQLNHAFTFENFLDLLYNKTWIVFCSKPEKNPKYNISYFAKYAKRPAIAESKLRHYDGQSVVFKYLDHCTKTYRRFELTTEQFIARFIQHIPDKNFRIIRYYGFLANRVRGTLLPIVYRLIDQKKTQPQITASFAELIKKSFGFDPLKCILCGSQMLPSNINFGKSTHELLLLHRELALLKKI